MDHILGVDASSTIVGYCIINSDEELIKTDYIKFHKDLNIIEKSLVLRQHLDVIKKDYNIKKVVIEDILTKFRAGMSSISTIITLSQFNILAQYQLYSTFDQYPHKINVRKARGLVGIKVPRGSNSKEVVFEVVKMWYPDFVWPLNRNGNIKTECYDMADSIVVAKSLIKEENDEHGKREI